MTFFVVILLYFSVAGFIYLAEIFDWQVELIQWHQEVGQQYESPSSKNILGTDIFGQSVLRKMIYGTKLTMR